MASPTPTRLPAVVPADPSTDRTAEGDTPSIPDPGGSLPRPFGRYELRRLLGRGGMGTVYLAHDRELDRPVALKIPRPVGDDPSGWRGRFLAEARAAATLTHPHICPVHDVGEHDGQPYLTMAFIDGETVAARLKRAGPLPVAEAVGLIRTVARAMDEAHGRGIVHRDLKPANLMLDRAGRPVVMDFGLALRATADDDLRLTLTGVALGTPAYMPPEQAGGDVDAIGPRSDVYALGVILYELLTGRTPFQAATFGKLLAMIERDPPPRPSGLNPAVDEALDALVLTCLAKDPADRFASAAALADALDEYAAGNRSDLLARHAAALAAPAGQVTAAYLPAPSRPRRRVGVLVAVAAGLLALLLAAGVIYVQTDHGELVVEMSDPAANVEVRVNGQEVVLDPAGKNVRVRAGANQKLVVTGPDFETVSETFDLKRNGKSVVHVTLKPKAGGVGPPKPPDPTPTPQTPAVPPRLVEYPKAPTTIDLAGWQVLADASKDEAEKWLADRKKAGHSVLWLDAAGIEGKPVYAAVAALDDRETGWTAFLDLSVDELPPVHLQKRINTARNLVASVSGFTRGEDVRSAVLLRPGIKSWGMAGEMTVGVTQAQLSNAPKEGLAPRIVRPYPIGGGQVRCGLYLETVRNEEARAGVDLTAGELADLLDKSRAAGLRPVSVTAYPSGGEVRYAATFRADPGKPAWVVERDLTAAGLKAKAGELAGQGFTPASVTGYAWDGAVRYCTVWVKDPPRPVPFPKAPTITRAGGCEVLADASRETLDKWLADRKAAKHSVMWLDAFLIGDKPVYSAVAALDDRQTDWKALLDVPAVDLQSDATIKKKWIDPLAYRAVVAGGYGSGDQATAVLLMHPSEGGSWAARAGFPVTPPSVEALLKGLRSAGFALRSVRVYGDADRPLLAADLEMAGRTPPELKTGLTGDELDRALGDYRAKGYRPAGVSGYVADGRLQYAVLLASKPGGEWVVVRNLPGWALKWKTAGMAGQGFRPEAVTGYGWDGAVRYVGVWVKESAKK